MTFVLDVDCLQSPIFPYKFFEIERFALRAAILHECQNYLGSRRSWGDKRRSAVLFWRQSREKGGYTSQFEVPPAPILGYEYDNGEYS